MDISYSPSLNHLQHTSIFTCLKFVYLAYWNLVHKMSRHHLVHSSPLQTQCPSHKKHLQMYVVCVWNSHIRLVQPKHIRTNQDILILQQDYKRGRQKTRIHSSCQRSNMHYVSVSIICLHLHSSSWYSRWHSRFSNERPGFISQLLSWMWFSNTFPSPSRQMLLQFPLKIRQDRILPHPLQFIMQNQGCTTFTTIKPHYRFTLCVLN